jgi:osmoprotectant transport system permease protein
MGYSPRRLLVRVELPLALPAILAGLRLAAVTTVGLATVASLVGSKNLGWLMLFPGFQQGRRTPILVGAVLAVLLAGAIDAVFLAIERLASPWRRADGGQRGRVEPRAAA